MKGKDKSCSIIEDPQVALELLEKDRIFILLDPRKTFMVEGHGFPFVGNGINLFNNYNDAKKCIDENKFDRWESAYPIGSLEKANRFTNIKNTIMIANGLGIENVFLDNKSYFKTEWFLNAIGIKGKMEFELRLTAEESVNIDESAKSSKTPVRFNPIDLYDYNNPFAISSERKNELSNAIISPEANNEKEVFNALNKNTLHENCFSQMLLRSKLIPLSIQKGDMNALSYFNMMQRVYATAILKQLRKHKSLYVLCDKESHEVFVRTSPFGEDKTLMYVSYTDLFKHQGPLEYKKADNYEEVVETIKESGVDGIVLTDGPSVNAVIDKEAFA